MPILETGFTEMVYEALVVSQIVCNWFDDFREKYDQAILFTYTSLILNVRLIKISMEILFPS